ncbi:MAG: hypothetical protein H7Y31_07055 [Chitinophagaceae bacterium]|nr:hypothetical protein [Chitinophagaceae bacterium]
MKHFIKNAGWLLFVGFMFGCNTTTVEKPSSSTEKDWVKQFDEQLELNGHRNWILVVDKAFPQQPGMTIINTNEKLLPVLDAVLKKIGASTHVKPTIFNDAELSYLNDSLVPGVSNYKAELAKTLNGATIQPLLHDTVFVRMDAASKLFSVTVLKTEEVIPYSSVFLQLDCGYWSGEKEQQLRQLMKAQSNKQ